MMNKFILLVFCAVLAASNVVSASPVADSAAVVKADSTALADADWHWTDLGEGARAGWAQIRLFNSVQTISIVKYPIRKFRTSLSHNPGLEASATDSLALRCGAEMAINGSYFNVKELTPTTFFSCGHKIVGKTSPNELFRVNGLMALKGRNGRKIDIMYCDTARYEFYSKHYYSAIAAGPLLLKDGVVQSFRHDKSFNDKRHPRSVVGVTDRSRHNKGGQFCYFIVVDGRFPGQGEGMTVRELALMSRYLGLSHSLNLDGGGSSTLWSADTGVINHPYDNHRFDHEGCRVVPNIVSATAR